MIVSMVDVHQVAVQNFCLISYGWSSGDELLVCAVQIVDHLINEGTECLLIAQPIYTKKCTHPWCKMGNLHTHKYINLHTLAFYEI